MAEIIIRGNAEELAEIARLLRVLEYPQQDWQARRLVEVERERDELRDAAEIAQAEVEKLRFGVADEQRLRHAREWVADNIDKYGGNIIHATNDYLMEVMGGRNGDDVPGWMLALREALKAKRLLAEQSVRHLRAINEANRIFDAFWPAVERGGLSVVRDAVEAWRADDLEAVERISFKHPIYDAEE